MKKHEHNHEHTHENKHEHDHSACSGHDHDHGNTPVILFFTGLGAYLIALFVPNPLFQNILFTLTVLTSGYHVIIEGISDTISSTKASKRFMPNIHILMALAALGAMLIGDFGEGALLILIFAGAHFLEHYAEDRSKREITSLLKMNPTEARLIQADGSTKMVAVTELKIGDRLSVLNGDQVPTDGIITDGYSVIDESAINGESIPAEKKAGDIVFGSTINGSGSFTMEVTKDSADTVFAKIIELVNQSQSNLSKTATKIKKIEPIYVTIVLLLVPVFILFGFYIMNWSWYESFYRGMVFLTVASPCALAGSAVPATLSAISNLARQGVLFKGGSYLSNLADIQAVAFDKTGTLTEGKPVVTDYFFVDSDKQDDYLDIIVSMEKTANHPLAQAIIDKFTDQKDLKLDVENKIGHGLITVYNGKNYQIGKPEIFTDVSQDIESHYTNYSNAGKTVVYIAEDGIVVGMIAMMDIPNQYAKSVITALKAKGIHTVMITGDSELTGKAVGAMIGIDEVIGNVVPENKAAIVKDLQNRFGTVAMLGDGVNDAPALVGADIGFAMGDGTDIAIDVADAVIMQNDLRRFNDAHNVSKRLNRIVWQNIIFSMLVVVTLVILNIQGTMDLPLGILVHEGSTLVVIFNGLRMLRTRS